MAFSASFVIKAVDKFSSVYKSLNAHMEKTNALARDSARQLRAVGAGLSNVGRDVAPMGVAVGAIGIAAIKASADLETLQMQFAVLLKDQGKATKLVADLRAFGAKTPLTMEQIGPAAKQLLAFGYAQDQILPKLQMMGDLASGSGADLGGLVHALGKIKAQGRLTAETLEPFETAGINIIEVLAQRLPGKLKGSTAAMRDLMSEGQISFKHVEGALTSLTSQGGLYFQMMEKLSGTTSGKWSTLTDSLAETAAASGDVLVESFQLKQVFTDIGNMLLKLAHSIGSFAKANPQMAKAISYAGLFFVALGPVLMILGQIAMTMAALKFMGVFAVMASGAAKLASFLKIIAVAVRGIALVSMMAWGPWIAGAAIIAGVAAAAVMLYKNWEPFRTLVDSIWERMKALWEMAKNFASGVSGFLGFSNEVGGEVTVNINAPPGVASVEKPVSRGRGFNLGVATVGTR